MAPHHAWWRWLFAVAAVVMPVGVAWCRLYRGMHHPWDLVGSVVLAAGWITVCYLVIRPNANQPRATAVAVREQAHAEHLVSAERSG